MKFESVNQVLYVLHNYKSFQKGEWPDPRRGADLGIPPSPFSGHATFENACLVAAEIALRVQKCGVDGLIVEERFGMKWNGTGMAVRVIARKRCLRQENVHSRISRVLYYIASGENIRTESYDDWKRQEHYRKGRHDKGGINV